jgi:cell wall-associated NlpC family hydrolase
MTTRNRLFAALAVGVSAVVAPGSAIARPSAHPRSWAEAEIETVVQQGILGPSVAAFEPQGLLTEGDLQSALARTWELMNQLPPLYGMVVPANPHPYVTQTPAAHVTIRRLDDALVEQLGLMNTARAFTQVVGAAGLDPRAGTGTEVVARMLDLRFDHPAAQDALEIPPDQPATRAEAAYSFAQLLRLDPGTPAALTSTVQTFTLPQLDPWQQQILTTAVSFIGYPYVWGGTSEFPETEFGVRSNGGFDCSGFVWRVYKLQAYPGEKDLASTLEGRTTAQMAGEVPAARRIRIGRLEPADVIFFGDRGPRSKPAQVGHMGIYLGNGWFIHASQEGVTALPLTGWYQQHFAWARRPLREAGLVD